MAAARSRRTLVVIIADLVLSTLAGWPEAAGRAEVIARRTGRPVLLVGDRSRAAPQRFAARPRSGFWSGNGGCCPASR